MERSLVQSLCIVVVSKEDDFFDEIDCKENEKVLGFFLWNDLESVWVLG